MSACLEKFGHLLRPGPLPDCNGEACIRCADPFELFDQAVLDALVAGFTLRTIAQMCGVTQTQIRKWRGRRRGYVPGVSDIKDASRISPLIALLNCEARAAYGRANDK